jgi:hypothetical protein
MTVHKEKSSHSSNRKNSKVGGAVRLATLATSATSATARPVGQATSATSATARPVGQAKSATPMSALSVKSARPMSAPSVGLSMKTGPSVGLSARPTTARPVGTAPPAPSARPITMISDVQESAIQESLTSLTSVTSVTSVTSARADMLSRSNPFTTHQQANPQMSYTELNPYELETLEKIIFIQKMMKTEILTKFNEKFMEILNESFNKVQEPSPNIKLPSYEYLHTLKRYVQVTNTLTSSGYLSGGKRYSRKRGGGNASDTESAYDHLDDYQTTILSETFSFNDDSADYNPFTDEKGLKQFFTDFKSFPYEINASLLEMIPKEPTQSSLFKLRKYMIAFITFIFLIFMSFQSKFDIPFMSTVNYDIVNHSTEPYFSVEPHSVTTYTLDSSNKTVAPISTEIIIDLSSQTKTPMKSMNDLIKHHMKYLEPKTLEQAFIPIECRLVSTPETSLSLQHQLFAHKENLLESFIELVFFIEKLPKTIKLPDEISEHFLLDNLKKELTEVVRSTFNNANPNGRPKNYIEIVNEGLLPAIINAFNAFSNKLSESDGKKTYIHDIFQKIYELEDFKKRSIYFKARMFNFAENLSRHFYHVEKKSIQFKTLDHCKTENTDANKIIIPLREYQQGLLFDLRMNYRNIAHRQIELYQDFKPVLTKILEIYGQILRDEGTAADPNKMLQIDTLKKYIKLVEQLEKDLNLHEELLSVNIPLGHINTILNNENTLGPQDKIKEIVDHLKKEIPQFNEEVVKFENMAHYNEMIKAMSANTFSAAGITITKIFHGIESLGVGVYNIGVSTGKQASMVRNQITDNVAPKLMISMGNVYSDIVVSLNTAAPSPEDKKLFNMVAIDQLSGVMYKLVMTTDFAKGFAASLKEEAVKRVPFFEPIYKTMKDIYNQQKTEINEQYIKNSRFAMQVLSTQLRIYKSKVATWKLVNNMDLVKLVYKLGVTEFQNTDPLTGTLSKYGNKEFAKLAMSVGKDYVKALLRIEELEMALILLHFQNDFLSNSLKTKLPPDNKHIDDSNMEILNKYHFINSESSNAINSYSSELLKKIVNLMMYNSMLDTQNQQQGGHRGRKQSGGGRVKRITNKTNNILSSSGGKSKAIKKEKQGKTVPTPSIQKEPKEVKNPKKIKNTQPKKVKNGSEIPKYPPKKNPKTPRSCTKEKKN